MTVVASRYLSLQSILYPHEAPWLVPPIIPGLVIHKAWFHRIRALPPAPVATEDSPLSVALRTLYQVYTEAFPCRPEELTLRLFDTFPASNSTRIGRESIQTFDAILTLRAELQCLLRPSCALPDPRFLLDTSSPRCDARTECWVRALRRYTVPPESPDDYVYIPPTPLLDLLMDWVAIVGIREDYTRMRRGQGRAQESTPPGVHQGRATHNKHRGGHSTDVSDHHRSRTALVVGRAKEPSLPDTHQGRATNNKHRGGHPTGVPDHHRPRTAHDKRKRDEDDDTRLIPAKRRS